MAIAGLAALSGPRADAGQASCTTALVEAGRVAAPAEPGGSVQAPTLLAQAGSGQASGASQAACVPPSARSPLDEVIMFGVNPPRAPDDPDFRYPQATGVISGDRVAILGREPAVANHFLVWANRCVLPAREVGAGPFPDADCRTFEQQGTPAERTRYNYKPNPWDLHLYPAQGAGKKTQQRYWAFFTSYGKADACTRMKIWAALGETQRAVRIGRESGFALEQIRTSPFHDAHLAAARRFPIDYPLKKHSPGAQPSSVSWPKKGDPFFIDVCIAPDMTLYEERTGADAAQRIDLFLLDYEPQDGRSEAHTVRFVGQIVDELAAEFGDEKSVLISANPLNRPSAKKSGLTGSSVGALLAMDGVKGVTITEYRDARFYDGKEVSPGAHLYRQLKIIEDAAGELPRALRHKIFVLYGLNNREKPPAAARAKLDGAEQTREFVRWYDLGGIIVWFEGSRIRTAGCDDPDWQVFNCLTLEGSYCG